MVFDSDSRFVLRRYLVSVGVMRPVPDRADTGPGCSRAWGMIVRRLPYMVAPFVKGIDAIPTDCPETLRVIRCLLARHLDVRLAPRAGV
jgi:hypothetical protein